MFSSLLQRNDALRVLAARVLVFLLVSTSFACLLGAFYKLWAMRVFALWVFPPAFLLLIFLYCDAKKARHPAANWILEGALGGMNRTLSAHLVFSVAPGFCCANRALPARA